MKRGTPDHWKMREFARLMKFPVRYGLPLANGIMERLWHYTAKYHPQGDVGKAPDWAIAEACGWDSKSATQLVDALVGAKWVDRCEKHRLLVHDWGEHADESVKKTLKNRGLAFLFPENSVQCAGKVPPALASASPEPKPLPLPDAQPPEQEMAQHPIQFSEYPLTTAAIQRRFATTDVMFVGQIVDAAARQYVSVDDPRIPTPTDKEFADAVEQAALESGNRQTSAALFMRTVPAVIGNWAKHGRSLIPVPRRGAIRESFEDQMERVAIKRIDAQGRI